MTKQRPFCTYRSVNFALTCTYPHAARTYVQSERTHYGTVFLISTVCIQHTCTHARMHAHTHTHTPTHTCAHTHTHAHTHARTHTHHSSSLPLHTGYDFPDDCEQIVKRIFKVYFSILAHIYLHHYQDMLQLRAHDILNSLFLHFVYFNQEFHILEHKDLAILEDLMIKLIQKDTEQTQKLREAGQLPT